jgi:hypothetical protein
MSAAAQPISPRKSQRVFWILQLTGWGAFSLSRYLGAIWVIKLPWLHFGLQLLCVDALAFGLSLLLRHYVRRHRWRELRLRKLIWRIVVAALICGLPLGILTQFTDLALMHDPNEILEGLSSNLRFELALPVAFALEIANWTGVFVIWLTIYFIAIAVREYRSARLRESETARALQSAELRLLKSQLNPHFLFNALNTVRSLIADNPTRAQDAVTRLAKTLRYTLTSPQDELVTLSQELDIVADYLELESMRFEDRLRIEIHVPDEAAGVRIPVMLLQTLVENAIKHGIAQLPFGGLLSIRAAVQNGLLTLNIENPRPPAPAPAAHEGVGLNNARDRLRLLFGARASLELDLSEPLVTTARLCIPVNS